MIDLRDPCQLGLLPVRQVLGVLPQRAAGSLAVAGLHAHPALAGGVSGVVADLIHIVASPRKDVERVRAPDRVRAVQSDLISDPLGRISRDVGDRGAMALTQRGEEGVEGPAVPSRGCPDQAASVVVDHDRDVAVALVVADLNDRRSGVAPAADRGPRRPQRRPD